MAKATASAQLRELRLRHYRSFADSKEIPIRRLTLIFGRNNAGKSTILQSLLLLKQTIEAPEFGPRLNTRGELVNGGGFNELVHQHRGQSFEWTLRMVLADGTDATAQMEFVRDDRGHLARLGRLLLEPADTERIEFKRGPGKGGPYEMRIGSAAKGGQATAGFQFSPSRFLPLVGPEPPKRGAPNKRHLASRERAVELIDAIERLVTELRAVGAFRRPPQRLYEYVGRVPDAADPNGEHVVAALIEDATRRGRKRDLISVVNAWLGRVGRVRLLSIKPIGGRRLFELRLRDTDSGRWANFADVGFGIGQALPVIVEGLRTPPGALFLVQEPEIHLHPDAQLAMADFLVDLALSGRQVIVETHSEAILLRVRSRLVARGRARALSPDDVSVIVVDKKESGSSFTTALEPDGLGQLENWPAGFMEEATTERLDLLEAMTKSAAAQ